MAVKRESSASTAGSRTAYDAIIVGGGAAGLFCAAIAGARGKRVLVVERNAEVGAKILISGGGRCNFTNLNAGPECFLSANPHFARSALSRYTAADFVSLVERYRIAYYEKTLGQLFCEGAGSAEKIVRMLLEEAHGAEIRVGCQIESISRPERFRIETSHGTFEAPALVIASGGLSIPKIGATDLAYRVARQFDVAILAPRPGLVPLTFAASDLEWMRPLSGVSTPVVARCGDASFREAALLTHRGLSGPAILQVSSYWREGEPIEIDWTPDEEEDLLVRRKRDRPKAHIKSALTGVVPARLADALALTLPPSMLSDVKDQALADAMRTIKSWHFTPNGTEGYAKAEVTVGGIDTNALSQKTMEVRNVPGLYFIGEAVDVTGWLGGYNFQWAWSSAWCAGSAL